VASVERLEGLAKRKVERRSFSSLAWCSSVEFVKWHEWLCRDGRQKEPQRELSQNYLKVVPTSLELIRHVCAEGLEVLGSAD
jgi:hypothetical protein